MGLDLIGSFIYGSDENVSLADPAVKGSFKGATVLAGYQIANYMPGFQIDYLNYETARKDQTRFTGRISWQPRENIQLILTNEYSKKDTAVANKGHKLYATIRAMF